MKARKPASQDQESIASIHRRTGVSRLALAAWRDDGVNIWDEDELQARIKTKRGGETEEDFGETKHRKLKAEADIKEIQRDAERGKYVTRGSQLEVGTKAALLMRSAFQKLSSDLTPLLAGRESAEVAEILDDYGWEKSNELVNAWVDLGASNPPGDDRGRPVTKKATSKRVGGKKRPPAKQSARAKVSRKRSAGTRRSP